MKDDKPHKAANEKQEDGTHREPSVHPTEANPLARPVDPAPTQEEAGQSTTTIPLDADETIGIP